MDKHICKISAHEFVEIITKGGDLVFGAVSSQRMLEGSETHRKYQKSSAAKSEVFLTYCRANDIAALEISGRIDLLHDDCDTVVIEELKSTYQKLSDIKEPLFIHLVQAKCYAGMYCSLFDVENISVKVTYISVDTLEHIEFTETYSKEQIIDWFYLKCDEILCEIKQDVIHLQKRNASANSLAFPYQDFRAGQRNMSGYVYLAIRDSYMKYICAPTGIGKTMAALYPSIRAMGEGIGKKVFYLTSKNTIKLIAADSMRVLYQSGFHGRSVTLTAKAQICPYSQQLCHPMYCPKAQNYYDKLPDALTDMSECGHYGPAEIATIAQRHNVCPFELSLDFSLKCDVIICDYNYAFDPFSHLKRFFDEGGDHILLIDEAHNLVDRARDMFSVSISKKEVLELKRLLPKSPDKIEKKIKNSLIKLNKVLLEQRKSLDDEYLKAQLHSAPSEEISSAVSTFLKASEPLIDSRIIKDYSAPLFEMFFRSKNYLNAEKNFDSYCRCFAEQTNKDVRYKIFCIDPSSRLQQVYDKIRSTILFSASLTPFSYFNRLLCTQESDNHLLPSPFPSDNLKILLNNQISTRYADREKTAKAICENIYTFATSLGGKTMIFFPSYKYMEEIYSLFLEMYSDIESIIQKRNMEENERLDFLSSFDDGRTSPLACFVVMGGIFSEGIDLVGDRLVGAVIVSVGLPQVCFERDIIKQYHEDYEEPGFNYAYTIPGFNKIIQAVGRIIRTSDDKGAALLIDQRFSYIYYQDLMPSWWKPVYYVKETGDIKKALNQTI